MPEAISRDPRRIDASKTRVAKYIDLLVNEGPALRQLLKRLVEARGYLALPRTSERAADVIEDCFASGTADGFNIMPPLMRRQFEILTGEVVPLLQKRGLFRRECQGST